MWERLRGVCEDWHETSRCGHVWEMPRRGRCGTIRGTASRPEPWTSTTTCWPQAMSTEVLFLVNGNERSPMGYRARAFAERLPDRWHSRIVYRSQGRFLSIGTFLRAIAAGQPSIVYVLDMAVSGVIAGAAARLLRRSVLVIDTGDAISALAQSIGRGLIGVLLTRALEAFGFHVADQIVVRGTFHRQWLAERRIDAEVIPDGVDLQLFRPIEVDSIRALRRELGVEKLLTVGLVGSSEIGRAHV